MAKLTTSGIVFATTPTVNQITTRRWIFQGASDPGGANQTNWTFYQASAPTGWTKRTDHNNKALRVVSSVNGGGTGGSTAFTTVLSSSFAYAGTLATSTATGSTSLTESQIPAHAHPTNAVDYTSVPAVFNPDGSFAYWDGGDVRRAGGWQFAGVTGTGNHVTGTTAESHNHPLSASVPISTTFTTGVRYIDVIVCRFNG